MLNLEYSHAVVEMTFLIKKKIHIYLTSGAKEFQILLDVLLAVQRLVYGHTAVDGELGGGGRRRGTARAARGLEEVASVVCGRGGRSGRARLPLHLLVYVHDLLV